MEYYISGAKKCHSISMFGKLQEATLMLVFCIAYSVIPKGTRSRDMIIDYWLMLHILIETTFLRL